MAKVVPFRGLRYALSRIDVGQVATQPYDKISKEMQDRYYALHPNNIIRIVLGKATASDSFSDSVYTRAAATLKEWRAAGVLENRGEPAFFVYYQRFTIPGTSEVRTRKGFIGLGLLEDYSNRVVYPHERTLTGPKEDRLELLRHTRTHFEQIFMLYEDPAQQIDQRLDQAIAGSKPDIDVQDEYGVMHTLWTISDPGLLEFIQKDMSVKKLIIADGHHRYETALAYRDEIGRDEPGPHQFMAMTFFNLDAPGLTILPTHRVISKLPGFDPKAFMVRASELFEAGETGVNIGVFSDHGNLSVRLHLKPGLVLDELLPDLSPKLRELDVVILHRLLIEKCLGISEEAVKRESYITYYRDKEAAMNQVRSGAANVAFLLNPTSLHQMRDLAYEGNVMPQKSTDFYPKVLSGLVMYSLDEKGKS